MEYYDARKDPIKIYFIDKLQKSICSNLNENKKENNFLSKIKIKEKKTFFSSLKKLEVNLKKKEFFEIRKNQRIKSYYRKIKKDKFENEAKNLLEDFNMNSDKKNKIIKNQLDFQENLINKKIFLRREKSLLKSHKTFSSSKTLTNFKNNKIFLNLKKNTIFLNLKKKKINNLNLKNEKKNSNLFKINLNQIKKCFEPMDLLDH